METVFPWLNAGEGVIQCLCMGFICISVHKIFYVYITLCIYMYFYLFMYKIIAIYGVSECLKSRVILMVIYCQGNVTFFLVLMVLRDEANPSENS